MKNVYDMVSGQFIEDEAYPTQNVESSFDVDCYHLQTALQLQLVEQQTTANSNTLPADLALQSYLMTE